MFLKPIFTLLLMLPCVLFAQHQITGQIENEQNHQPIAHVNIYNSQRVFLTESDAKGMFSLEIPSLEDSLWVRCIGFVPQKIAATALLKSPKIILTESHTLLQEVNIRQRQKLLKQFTIGYCESAAPGKSTTTDNHNLLGVFMPAVADCKDCYIDKIYVRIMVNDPAPSDEIKLVLWSKGADGKPESSLIPDGIRINIGNLKPDFLSRSTTLTVDVRPYHIPLPANGVMVAYGIRLKLYEYNHRKQPLAFPFTVEHNRRYQVPIWLSSADNKRWEVDQLYSGLGPLKISLLISKYKELDK